MQCAKLALKASFRSRIEIACRNARVLADVQGRHHAVILLFHNAFHSRLLWLREESVSRHSPTPERTPYGNSAADRVEPQTKVKLRSLEDSRALGNQACGARASKRPPTTEVMKLHQKRRS